MSKTLWGVGTLTTQQSKQPKQCLFPHEFTYVTQTPTHFSINVSYPHMLAHHIKPTMATNYVAFNVIYVRLGVSAPVAAELVCTEGINSLRLLGGLNADRVNSLVKVISPPDGSAIGNAVSEIAEHYLIVACHICKYWRCTSREIKTCANLVTTGDLFEETEYQMEIKRNWDND